MATVLKRDAGKVDLRVRFKNMLAKKGQGSAYQRILHTMELARQSQAPMERLGHMDTMNALIDEWHHANSPGTRPRRQQALSALKRQLRHEQPSILRRLNAEPTGQLSEFDRERIGVLSADVHGRNSANIERQAYLSSGAINEVFKTKFSGDSKPMVTKTAEQESFGVAQLAGIYGGRSGSPGFARRNVATSRAAEAFGLSVIPKTHFATRNGELGTAMELVPGASPIQTVRQLLPRERGADLNEAFDQVESGGSEAEMARDIIEKMQIKRHMAGGKTGAISQHAARYRPGKVDMYHPTTQRQLLQLQALDWVTLAGMDRHGANYIVAPSVRGATVSGGEVKGIDNDGSWGGGGLQKDPTALAARTLGSHSMGLPPRLHESDAQKFKNMAPETLRAHLGHTVSDEDFGLAVDRLNRLKAHISTLEADGKLLQSDGFGASLYHQLEAEHNAKLEDHHGGQFSYIARDGMGIRHAASTQIQHYFRRHLERKKRSGGG